MFFSCSFPECRKRPGWGEIARARHLGTYHRYFSELSFLNFLSFMCLRQVSEALSLPSLVTEAKSKALFQQVVVRNILEYAGIFPIEISYIRPSPYYSLKLVSFMIVVFSCLGSVNFRPAELAELSMTAAILKKLSMSAFLRISGKNVVFTIF